MRAGRLQKLPRLTRPKPEKPASIRRGLWDSYFTDASYSKMAGGHFETLIAIGGIAEVIHAR